MTVVAVSRWKGDFQNIGMAREIAPLLKKHGALSVQVGNCAVGTYAGQIFTVLTFQDWEAYGKAMQGLASDAEYQRRYAEASKVFELQGRALMVAEDL